MDVIVFTVFLATAMGTGLGLLIWRSSARREEQESTLDWFRSYSVERYRPMQRLLNESDYRFLENQPGYQPSIARELRSERKQIARAYLGQLRQDFRKLTHIGKLMVVEAPADRSDLADAISRLTYQFYWNLLVVHLCLVSPHAASGAHRLKALLGSMASVHETISVGGNSDISLTA